MQLWNASLIRVCQLKVVTFCIGTVLLAATHNILCINIENKSKPSTVTRAYKLNTGIHKYALNVQSNAWS